MKKFVLKYKETIFYGICVLLIILKLFAPKSGEYVLLSELLETLLLCMIAVGLAYVGVQKFGTSDKRKKISKYCAIVLCVLLCILVAKNLTLDVISGPKEIQLTEITVGKSRYTKSFIGFHYYLYGNNKMGQNMRLEISGDDYTKLQNEDTIFVTYYENTNRVVEYQ